jgi:hypothetical protein
MTNKQLSDLIKLSVKVAIKEELQQMKQEIIYEMRNGLKQVIPDQPRRNSPLVETQRKFRQNYQVQPKQPNKRLSNNPILNELLMHTEPTPKEEVGYMGMFETDEGEINVPTSESGRPLTSAPTAVIEAMNRDYSGMFAKEEKPRQVQSQPAPNGLRNAIIGRMEGLNGDMNFDDEEDFSFLDQVS